MTYKPKPLNTFSQENWKKLYIPHSALPTVLYRGIKFDDKSFVTYPLNGDLTMPPKHKNEHGEAVISDGQEYGMYMSNKQLLVDMYTGKKNDSMIQVRQISDIALGDRNLTLCTRY